MKKIGVLTVLLIISIQASFAAKGLPGYVVTLDGDTLHGRILKSNFSDLRGTKFFGKDGSKMRLVPGEISAFKVDVEYYVSVPVDHLKLTDDFKNNGNVFVQRLMNGPVSLYRVGYCFGKKTINDRQNRVFKERCPKIYFLKRGEDPYFEAFRDEELTLKKVQQKNTTGQLAGYFEDYEDLSKNILFERYKRTSLDLIVKEYNDWKLKQEK